MMAPIKFQLTHSRGVRQVLFDSGVATASISTHALTWSATKSYFVRRLDSQISTHALTWSATSGKSHFSAFCISTHALTWSATISIIVFMDIDTFQLTHSRGVRRHCVFTSYLVWRFQLTWSATFVVDGYLDDELISTHALTWSATSYFT